MNLTELEQVRKNRLDQIRQLGDDPYGRANPDTISISRCRELFATWETNTALEPRSVGVQGRIILLRDNGGLIWAQVRDETGTIQVAISKKDVRSPTDFQLGKLLDLGDIILPRGSVRRTKTGEVTIWCESLDIQCKSLAHPPDKVAGLQDIEQRYRKRYLDMAFNGEFTRTLQMRSAIVSTIRHLFSKGGYTEVETPMLHGIAGGAAARPFKTHLNALDVDLFLRVAPELYLKRLIVGGMSRVFEINRNFRNEGIDATHNPEFTALEAYGVNEDVDSLIDFVGNMLSTLVHILKRENGLCSNLPLNHIAYDGKSIDFGSYKVVSYQDLYQEGVGRDLLSETDFVAANRRFEEECECLIDPCIPTFVVGYPAVISPLTKQSRDNPLIADRADLFIGGMEIGTIYTEQNDPQVQFDVFSRQIDDADENTHRTMDEDFVEALKVGMPPTGGLGLGIDRLVMLLCDKTSVRDVLAFPFMRPLTEAPL